MIITVLFRCYFPIVARSFFSGFVLFNSYLLAILFFFNSFFLSKGNVGAMGSRGEPGQPGGMVDLS